MPNRKFQSKVSGKIEKVLKDYKASGKIGNIQPKSMVHARRIAAAIGYKFARKGPF